MRRTDSGRDRRSLPALRSPAAAPHAVGAEAHGGSWTVRIAYPSEVARYLIFKGSVSVEGISLTIAELTDEFFAIAIIPKTWEVTNFSHLHAGDEVNLEVDVIAKYVERLLHNQD